MNAGQAVTEKAVRDWIAVPGQDDDKYSRGVLGMVTGSVAYPGAAVLGVQAAWHTGVGMVRYLGPEAVTDMVLQARPETVTRGSRVQAWVLGSGQEWPDGEQASPSGTTEALRQLLSSAVPLVLDAGALGRVAELSEAAGGPEALAALPVLITPHAGELARLLGCTREDVLRDGAQAAVTASLQFGVHCLLKGSRTVVSDSGGAVRGTAGPSSPWLAVAGSGDVLGGVLGALLATNADRIAADPSSLAQLALAAARLHQLAAEPEFGLSPFPALALAERMPRVLASLLGEGSARNGSR